MTAAELTVVVNLHREGVLAHPALTSAFLAVDAAARHGVRTRVLAVLDRPDDATRDEVARFADRLCGTLEIDAGELSAARNLGLQRVETPWAALLDGDDLLDRDWLWRGLRYLEEGGGGKAVAHARVRLTFGSERHGRVQLSSESPFFHPLNLIASWHWAADTIAPVDLFQRHPFLPNDHAGGFGGEDWHWTCETLAAGVRHLVVPETVYFYRRQARHVSLGMVPGITFRPTRLLDENAATSSLRTFPSAALRFADRLEEPTGPAERWIGPPGWLRAAVGRAARLDLEVHALGRVLSAVPLETPPIFPGVGHLYLKLMGALGKGRERVVLLCDRLTPEVLGSIDGFLRAHARRRSPHLDVLVVSLAVPDAPARAPDPLGTLQELTDAPWLRLRQVDLGAEATYGRLSEGLRQDLLVRFLLQVRPLLAAGMDSCAFDRVVSRWGDVLRSAGVRTVRLLGSRYRGDEGFIKALRLLDVTDAGYSVLACFDAGVARRLGDELPLPDQTAIALPTGKDGDEGATGASLLGLLEASAAPVTCAADQRPAPPREETLPDVPPEPDVSCIVVVRSEGRRLIGTLRALADACGELRRAGRMTEVVVVADRPGPRTRGVLRSLPTRLPGARLVETDLGDDASALNVGVSAARGRHVALLGGGDAVTPGFLVHALRAAETEGPDVIARPGLVVELGQTLDAVVQADMRDEGLDIGLLAGSDLWAPVAFARRDLLLRFPWRPAAPGSGWGGAAWHWSCETVQGGCRHVAVPRTAVFRLAGASGERDLTLGTQGWTTLPPSRFFTDHSWLERSAPPSANGNSGLPNDWNDAAYLNANPDAAAAVRFGEFPSGWAHFCLHGRTEGRVATWLRRARPAGPASWRRVPGRDSVRSAVHRVRLALGAKEELGRRAAGTAPGTSGAYRRALFAWLSGETSRVAASVPDLAGMTLSAGIRRPPRDSSAREAYRVSWDVISRARPTHVLLVPRLGPGGAELACSFCIDAILSRPQNRVLVVSTDSEDDGCRAGLPEQAAFLPFATIAAGCPPDEQVEVLTRLLVNSSARSLHVFYSHVGWEVLRRHAAPLAELLRIYVSVFSVPPIETGLDPGYARLLPALRRHVTTVFTDNRRAADSLVLACGLERRQVVVLRHPVSPRSRFRSPVTGSDLVLWAGRLDADKRPELLREIAERLPRKRFDVWGSPVLDDGRLFAPLASLPNVRLRGPFAGFGSIPDAPYHCFLYTSLWDGIPNVLLEAVASGLLAVGSDVGAVREVLGDGGGILVRPPGDPGAYVAALERSSRDPGAARETAERGRRRIVETHTRTGFLASISSVPGYL